MVGNRSRDTRPEVAIRSALHRAGLRFRKHYAALPGSRTRVDVAFPRRRIAIQIDGCFWHRCPEHGTQPAAHSDYWAAKMARNAERDRRTDDALVRAGWVVLRIWEHERVEDAVAQIRKALESRPDFRR